MAAWAPRVLEAVGLVAVVAFVASVAYLPHANSANDPGGGGPGFWELAGIYEGWLVSKDANDYEYTVHVDENMHWVSVAAAQRADSLRHPDELTGDTRDAFPLSLRGLVHERGFHVAVLMFQELTGLDWLTLFRFLPAVWAGVFAALVWAALRPWWGALPAAALVGLVPTSARFLGPGFLVPIGFGLAWVAAAMVLLPEASRRGRATALLLLLVVWAFFVHLVVGFAAVLLLLSALPFATGNRKGLALLSLSALIPMAWLYEAFRSDIDFEFRRMGDLPLDFTVFDQLGLAVLALWPLGCGLVMLRPPRRARLVVQAVTVASVGIFAFMLANLALDLRLYALYDRWHQPFALFAAIPVAHAIVVLAEEAAERMSRRGPRRAALRAPLAACLVVGLLAVAADGGVAGHVKERYYHVLEAPDWHAFTWAAANVNGTYDVFLSEPWKAPIFTALSGKQPHTWLRPGYPPVRGDDYEAYLRDSHGDAAWLVGRDISLVIDPQAPTTPHFQPAGPRTWVLDWAEARELDELRGSP